MENDIETQIYDLLSTISEEEKLKMLSKNWLSHDARWQIGSVSYLGWDKANKLNQNVTKQIGKVLMLRMMKALKISEVKNIYQVNLLLGLTTYFNFLIHPSTWYIKTISNEEYKLVINECFTFENVKRVGATGGYECACHFFREGLFEAICIEIEQTCQKNLMKGDNKCKICIKIKNWNNQGKSSVINENLMT